MTNHKQKKLVKEQMIPLLITALRSHKSKFKIEIISLHPLVVYL
jgi:hypothetical protein